MCGICGVIQMNSKLPSEDIRNDVARMMVQMTRRGPDDQGLWHDKYCALGFRRLSILDLTPTGHQPMLSQDGRFALVFNGELYNFRELRAILEKKGVNFRSTGDAEVALYALAEWGTDALESFNGMYGLAFYDTLEKKLFLARDHAGIKPLYYANTSQGLVFASQYNQVIQHPWAKDLEISQDALSLYLRFGWIPAPYALLQKSHLLEAGSWLQVDADGEITRGRFYEFPKYQAPSLFGEKAVDALDETLDRAVRRHLVSDVPVGLFLSGGIDSPLVAAKARQISGGSLPAFTIGVAGDPAMDESADAAAFAAEIGLDFHLRSITSQSALDLMEDVILASTEPTADFSIFPTLLVSQFASESVKVVLTGDGGDEPFWGYVGRFVPMLEQAAYFKKPLAARYASIAANKFLGIGNATREVLYPDVGCLFQKKHTLMAEKDLANLFPDLNPLPKDFDLFEYDGSNMDHTAQWLRWNEFTMHLQRVLMKADRASMHCSLETRLPLLDKEVLSVAAQTDWRTCLDLEKRLGKIPLRKVLSMHVKHQTQAKKGFTVPMHQWLQEPLQDLLQEKVINRRDFLGQPVNHGYLSSVNQRLLDGDRSKAWGLWLLLSLVLWEETHLINNG